MCALGEGWLPAWYLEFAASELEGAGDGKLEEGGGSCVGECPELDGELKDGDSGGGEVRDARTVAL